MSRFFNTAGPIKKEKHYNIDPISRIDINEILTLIEQEKYFVLHAPWQTGKTSYLHALRNYLDKEGKFHCLYINVEEAQAAREKVKEGIRSIIQTLARNAHRYLDDPFLKENWKQIFEESSEFSALHEALSQWSLRNSKAIVLFVDEIDSLVGDTLISVLRQLRAGYTERPQGFPQSIILCGIRDVRDYRIYSDREKTSITGGSAFNIKAESLRLGNFTFDEIKQLYQQHSQETGQLFDNHVFSLVWDLTEGQPWLVNALGYEVCFKMKDGRDRNKTIDVNMINKAKENLILRRETHIHQLVDRLKEDRVKHVIEPILVGSKEPEKITDEDIDYVVDLGLIQKKPYLRIANKIYQEIIPRQLTYSTGLTMTQEASWYTKEDGSLDMDKLLSAFQDFFRKHFESWVDGFNYAEAGPQLLLQAFMQRIVNSGGRVEREYGLGRQRTDLLLIWPYKNNECIQQVVVELKLRYGRLEKIIEKGLEQTWQYMDKCGTNEGYLLIFDRSKKASWKEKIFKKEKTFKKTRITVYGM